MPEIDAELVKGLKMAKSKTMYFGFVSKGTDGKLIVEKKKIKPKVLAEAKKELGGGTLLTGKVSGPLNEMIFEVIKEPPGSMVSAIRKVAKLHAGLSILPTFQVAGNADEDEEGDEGEGEDTTTPEESTASVPPAPPPPPGTPPNDAAENTLNLGPWTAARQNAINDLRALATKVAATKHATAAGVLKEISSIIQRLPATPAPKDIDKLENFIRTDETISAAEDVPGDFHTLSVREPLLQALEGLRQ